MVDKDWGSLQCEEVTLKGVSEHLAVGAPDPNWLSTVIAEAEAVLSQSGVSGIALRSQTGEPMAIVYGGFLVPSFASQVLDCSDYWVNAKALRAVNAGQRIIFPTPERNSDSFIRASQAGLHLHLFRFDWHGGHDSHMTFRLRSLLGQDVADRYMGAPIKTITLEAHNVYDTEAEQAGFRVHRRYIGEDACLMVADSNSLLDCKSPSLMMLLTPLEPRLKLTTLYRRVLYYYMRGHSDARIADTIGLSRNSIKTYWDRIFTAFEEIISFEDNSSKRSTVRQYLKLHPEECWPR